MNEEQSIDHLVDFLIQEVESLLSAGYSRSHVADVFLVRSVFVGIPIAGRSAVADGLRRLALEVHGEDEAAVDGEQEVDECPPPELHDAVARIERSIRRSYDPRQIASALATVAVGLAVEARGSRRVARHLFMLAQAVMQKPAKSKRLH